ncbi:PepSY domain-containing protein, partial [Escherichia coli]|uniref:PepSY domain-containing protein n=1 Tax=Escherichia coli TaxID=562 RepID=UPI003F1E8B51
MEQLRKAPVAQLVDTLHQFVGLPFPDAVSRPIMGIIALMYAVALISGVIVLLPTLVKDFFAVRVGKNIKRMWL